MFSTSNLKSQLKLPGDLIFQGLRFLYDFLGRRLLRTRGMSLFKCIKGYFNLRALDKFHCYSIGGYNQCNGFDMVYSIFFLI